MFFERKGRKAAPLSLFFCKAAHFDVANPLNLSVFESFSEKTTDKFTNPSRTFRFFHTERGYNVVKSPLCGQRCPRKAPGTRPRAARSFPLKLTEVWF